MKKDDFKPILITSLFVVLQLVIYKFCVFIEAEPTLIGNAIDNRISFNILGIIPYCSWFLLLFIVPFIIYKKDKRDFVKYIFCYFFMSLIGDIIYVIFPTTVIRPEVYGSGILYVLAKIVFRIDNPVLNCFPSLHCAVATLFVLMINKKKYPIHVRIIISTISLLVIPSTLLIKQHAFVDAVSGVILAIIVYLLSSKMKKVQNGLYRYFKL